MRPRQKASTGTDFEAVAFVDGVMPIGTSMPTVRSS
jgi:hypothetical protein